MSNYSSVVILFSCCPDDHSEEQHRETVERSMGALADALRGSHDGSLLGLPGGDSYSCEDVVRLTVNHFNPDEFWPAADEHAPWLDLTREEWQSPTLVLYKPEGEDRYLAIPSPERGANQPTPTRQ